MTEWRTIDGWPAYEVNDIGQVRTTQSGPGRVKGRILKPDIIKGGYLRVTLSRDGQTTRHVINRLVCEAFHGPSPSILHEARHLDGNPQHNSKTNLAWGTHKENYQDRVRHGTTLHGARNPNLRYSNDLVAKIQAAHKSLIPPNRVRVPKGARMQLLEKFQLSPVALCTILERDVQG